MLPKLAPCQTVVTALAASLLHPELEFFKIEDSRKGDSRVALAIKGYHIVSFGSELSLTQCVSWTETYYSRAKQMLAADEGTRLYGIQREMMVAVQSLEPGSFKAGEVLL